MTGVSRPVVRVASIDSAEYPLPAQATNGAAGYDVCAREALSLAPGAFGRIGTGLKLEIPHGYEAQVRPRSGLAAKHGVTVLNAPGTIDSDYRGEVCVILINHGSRPFCIEPGMRIAQLVFAPVTQVGFERTEDVAVTQRGAGGFGSTGILSMNTRGVPE
ncbi:MAG TPA: dUTP diphosphatase [Candidatus Ozemobacteraceae bacterium]|nr:dUTP diphosphatase [Candidatus Ozemobacteraceae bacterium]